MPKIDLCRLGGEDRVGWCLTMFSWHPSFSTLPDTTGNKNNCCFNFSCNLGSTKVSSTYLFLLLRFWCDFSTFGSLLPNILLARLSSNFPCGHWWQNGKHWIENIFTVFFMMSIKNPVSHICPYVLGLLSCVILTGLKTICFQIQTEKVRLNNYIYNSIVDKQNSLEYIVITYTIYHITLLCTIWLWILNKI